MSPRLFLLRRLVALLSRCLVPGALCCIISSATAATLAGATVPDNYTVNGQILNLNGVGLRTLTIFAVRAYVAALYLPRPNHDAAQILASPEPKVILLRFLHSASKERVEHQYREGEQDNCGNGGCDPADEADFRRLVASAPAVSPGDTFTYIFTNNGVRVLFNDKLAGEYANRDLAYRLLLGFIGAHPPSPGLRRQMLGLPAD